VTNSGGIRTQPVPALYNRRIRRAAWHSMGRSPNHFLNDRRTRRQLVCDSRIEQARDLKTLADAMERLTNGRVAAIIQRAFLRPVRDDPA